MKARQLKVIAAWINEHRPELSARVERDRYNTDRQVGRLRWPGKGRVGNRIIVTLVKTGVVVLDHNSAETYRHNSEVEAWLQRWIEGRQDKKLTERCAMDLCGGRPGSWSCGGCSGTGRRTKG